MSASPDEQRLTFTCPHCHGPVHVVDSPQKGVACQVGHRLQLEELVLEQTRASAQAAWRAVRALRERAAGSRWALSQPELYGIREPHLMQQEAESDEDTARSLQQYAEALDQSVGLDIEGRSTG